MRTCRTLKRWQVIALLWTLAMTTAWAGPAEDSAAARSLYEARRYTEARAAFRALAMRQPGNVELHFYLGRLALWFNDGASALAYLEKAVHATPRDARVQNALGDTYGLMAQQAGLLTKLGWARKCLGAYERAVELAPREVAYRWSLIGYYCLAPRIAGGSCDKALVQAGEIGKLDPMAGRIARATLYLAERQPAAAFAQFDEVLRSNTDDFLALYQIGRIAAVSGQDLERGRAALQRCLCLAPPVGDGMPTLASAHHRLGNILEKLGDASGAQHHYATALRLLPDFRSEKETLRN